VVDAVRLASVRIAVSRSVEYVPGWRRGTPALTLVHLSDLFVRTFGDRERRAVAIVNEARPDLIVISGGLLAEGGDVGALTEFLKSLRAARGRVLVFGAEDHASGLADGQGAEVARRSGFTLLRNAGLRVATRSGPVVIAGLDDPFGGHDSLVRALKGAGRRELTMLVADDPAVALDLGNWDIDLVLTGGGPDGGALAPRNAAPWDRFGHEPDAFGWLDTGGGARLHVARGLAARPLGFLSPPRVDVVSLRGGPPPTSSRARAASAPA
jgi:predicted MPP superfamily phosphohydrolase